MKIMIKPIILIIFLTFLFSWNAFAQVSLERQDHRRHVGVSFGATMMLSHITKEPLASFVTVNFLGLFKEALDAKNGGRPDVTDLEANLLGSGIGLVTYWSF